MLQAGFANLEKMRTDPNYGQEDPAETSRRKAKAEAKLKMDRQFSLKKFFMKRSEAGHLFELPENIVDQVMKARTDSVIMFLEKEMVPFVSAKGMDEIILYSDFKSRYER